MTNAQSSQSKAAKPLDVNALLAKMPRLLIYSLMRISQFEKIKLDELIQLVMQHADERALSQGENFTKEGDPLSLFCLLYFAQASTLNGHAAALHGQGARTITQIVKTMERTDVYCGHINSERNGHLLAHPSYTPSKVLG